MPCLSSVTSTCPFGRTSVPVISSRTPSPIKTDSTFLGRLQMRYESLTEITLTLHSATLKSEAVASDHQSSSGTLSAPRRPTRPVWNIVNESAPHRTTVPLGDELRVLSDLLRFLIKVLQDFIRFFYRLVEVSLAFTSKDYCSSASPQSLTDIETHAVIITRIRRFRL